jgi:hypothetical protein
MKFGIAIALVLASAWLPGSATAATDVPSDPHVPSLLQYTHEVAETAGIGRLSATAGTPGVEELRIWVGFGIVTPEHMLRLRIDATGKVSGELWVHFPGDLSGVVDIHERKKIRRQWTRDCAKPKRGRKDDVCLSIFRTPVDWRDVYERLRALGIATLPDESALPRTALIALDGISMVVEVRNGAAYRAYAYSNPMLRDGPEAEAAVKILHAVGEVIRAPGRPK